MNSNLFARLSNQAFLRLIHTAPDKTDRIILGITLLGILAANLILVVINLLSILIRPSSQDTIYLIQDFVFAMILLLNWWIFQRGHTEIAAHLLLTTLTLLAIFLLSPEALSRSMIVFVYPIMLASFILQPHYSFLFASLATFGYTVYYFDNLEMISYSYNYFAVMIFFLTAFFSWIVSHFLNRANREVVHAYEKTLEGWARTLELRDDETNGHSRRVIDLTEKLARRLILDDEQLANLRRGVMLHDIGKIGIPDRILLKPGPLEPEEWNLMHQHPILALDLLRPIPYLQNALEIPYCHHEKWDGSGYPRGLRGDEIPVSARMFAVVDVWDALTSDRPYRAAWSRQEAASYLAEQSGKHFDPDIVPQFLGMLKEEGLS